jgi:hypothetical protein
MNTRCTVCQHPQRSEIERDHLAGASLRTIAAKYGKGKNRVGKHLREHLPAAAQKAALVAEEREVLAGDTILGELQNLCGEARRLQKLAEKKKDVRTALTAIRELVRLVELKARVLGEIRDREITVNVVQLDPETAEHMAEIYLMRRRNSASVAGIQPIALLQSTENEEDK